MKLNRKKQIQIVAACSVAIFSLAALIGGSYAWFMFSVESSITAGQFAVVNSGSCTLEGVNLIKFDYQTETYGSGEYEFTATDYLNPENGSVNKYAQNVTENSFGYLDNQNWIDVESMNTYDPYDAVIFGSSLKDLNCNAVYEFTVSSNDIDLAYLTSTIIKLTKTKQENDLFLTTCVNFDIFTADDLLDTNPAFTDGEDTKLYYPSYIDKSQTLSANEDKYYKIAYLASLRQTHPHFYGSNDTSINLSTNTEVEFVYDSTADTKLLTFYVNVDYAPSELDFVSNLIYAGNIRAVYDFSFKFDFTRRGEND